jgi:hypothetical protein
LIVRSILRSITSDPTSIAAIPTRSPAALTRARLRLTRRVVPLRGASANDHTHAPSSERADIARSGSSSAMRMPGSFGRIGITSPTMRFCCSGTMWSTLRMSRPNMRSIQSYV